MKCGPGATCRGARGGGGPHRLGPPPPPWGPGMRQGGEVGGREGKGSGEEGKGGERVSSINCSNIKRNGMGEKSLLLGMIGAMRI